jgi:hypothetical protein
MHYSMRPDGLPFTLRQSINTSQPLINEGREGGIDGWVCGWMDGWMVSQEGCKIESADLFFVVTNLSSMNEQCDAHLLHSYFSRM